MELSFGVNINTVLFLEISEAVLSGLPAQPV